MIRTIVNVNNKNLTLALPDDFLGKKIEVIAFVLEEVEIKTTVLAKAKTFSAVELDTRGFNFNRDEANER